MTVSHGGYIKRVPLSTYRAQRRGGRGRAGMSMRDEDFISQVFVASTHAPVLFFTTSGRVYKLKVYRLPVGTPQARGKAMVDLLPNLAQGETHLDGDAAARGRKQLGRQIRGLRHGQGQCPPQRALRFRQRLRQRQDRDEVRGRGRRRSPDRASRSAARMTMSCWRRATAAASASRRGCARLHRAAARSACAASLGAGRCGDLDVDPAPRGGADERSAMLSCASTPSAGAPSRRRPRRTAARKARAKSRRADQRRAISGSGRARGIRARAHRERLRQAQLGL